MWASVFIDADAVFVFWLFHWTELPKAAIRILSNMTFLFVSLSYTAESAIVTAFITFIPKFIESQFGIPASNASIYTGTRLSRFQDTSNSISHSIFPFFSLTLLRMVSFLVISHISHVSHSVHHIKEHVLKITCENMIFFFTAVPTYFIEAYLIAAI